MTLDMKDEKVMRAVTAHFISENADEIFKISSKIGKALDGRDVKIGLAAIAIMRHKLVTLSDSTEVRDVFSTFSDSISKILNEPDMPQPNDEKYKGKRK